MEEKASTVEETSPPEQPGLPWRADLSVPLPRARRCPQGHSSSEPGVRKNLARSRKTPEGNDFHPGGARLWCHQRGSVEDVTREGFATRTCPAMEAGPLHTTQAQTQICQGVPPQGCGIKRAREGRCRGDWTAQVLLVSGMHTS